MVLVDILVVAVLATFLVKGFLKGLIREVCSLLGLLVGGWAGFTYSSSLALMLQGFIRLPQHVGVGLAFVLIFLFSGLLFFLLGHVLTVMLKIMLLGGINRVGGMLFGLLEGAFLLCMLLYLGTTKPVPEKLRNSISGSALGKPFVTTGREIIGGWREASPGVQPAQEKAKKKSYLVPVEVAPLA